jgi:hypothetical protein
MSLEGGTGVWVTVHNARLRGARVEGGLAERPENLKNLMEGVLGYCRIRFLFPCVF